MSSKYMSTVDAGGMGEVHWEDKFDSATSLQSPMPVASSKQLINLSTLKNTCNNQQSFNLSASRNGERKKKIYFPRNGLKALTLTLRRNIFLHFSNCLS